ncbi:hypothetical protein IU436_25360 [Nocardia farcinica]|uniref:hypothetical protein n=1 Tax=Nocardia farcinica TaxID=37329 RepID=UPI001896315B|nr:hypothetical protein [Nocardia farcinica]MBF6422021.1 hypothetical protein [Nocardia farcinica]MBF6433678.1 hypothetical protein [Nocardia farcinica]MBF6504704.1 hypothetical protein [Nocardia farcinica]
MSDPTGTETATPATAAPATPAAPAAPEPPAAPAAPEAPNAAAPGAPAGNSPAASDPGGAPATGEPKTLEDYQAIVRKLRDENASWRTKMRDAEPILRAHAEAEEAAKTDLQRATEQLTAAEQTIADLTREAVAAKYGVPEEDYDFLGSGTREEMEAKAARYQARFAASSIPTPPPSDRPVEGLRPGASPTPPAQPDTSYPAAWKP